MIIRGQKFPVVGRVCMDHIWVDLGNDSKVKNEDDVILFGKQQKEQFSINEICQILDTIPYEVCCWISKRVPRVYISD